MENPSKNAVEDQAKCCVVESYYAAISRSFQHSPSRGEIKMELFFSIASLGSRQGICRGQFRRLDLLRYETTIKP